MTAPGFIEIEVFDPDSGDTKTLRMELERLHWLRTRAPPRITHSAPLLKQVLRAPALVYEGLRRENQEEGGSTSDTRGTGTTTTTGDSRPGRTRRSVFFTRPGEPCSSGGG